MRQTLWVCAGLCVCVCAGLCVCVSVFGALGWCVSVRDSSSCAIAGVEKRESVRNPITTAFNSYRLSLDTHTHTHTDTQEAEVLGKPSLDQEQSPLAYLTHTHRNVKTTCRTEPRQTRCNFLRFHRAKTFWVVNPLFIFLFTATYCTGIHISAVDSYHALIKVFSCFATQTNTFSLMPAKNLTSYSTIM